MSTEQHVELPMQPRPPSEGLASPRPLSAGRRRLVRFDNSEAPTTATVPLQSDTQSTALSTTEIETNLSFDDEGTPSGSPKLSAAEPFNQIPDFHLSPLPPSAALPTNTLNTSTTQSWTTLSNHPLFLAHPSSLRLNLATAAAMLNGGSARVSATELRQLQLTQQDQFLSANALQARIRDFEASFGDGNTLSEPISSSAPTLPTWLPDASSMFPDQVQTPNKSGALSASQDQSNQSTRSKSQPTSDTLSAEEERENVMKTWLQSLISESAQHSAPLLCETVDPKSGLRALEVNSATVAAIELSLQHRLSQQIEEFSLKCRAIYEKRVRNLAFEAAAVARSAAEASQLRVNEISQNSILLAAAAERKLRKAKRQVQEAEHTAMEATEQVKAANEKQLLWQIQREEWREQRRRERQDASNANKEAKQALEDAFQQIAALQSLVTDQQSLLERRGSVLNVEIDNLVLDSNPKPDHAANSELKAEAAVINPEASSRLLASSETEALNHTIEGSPLIKPTEAWSSPPPLLSKLSEGALSVAEPSTPVRSESEPVNTLTTPLTVNVGTLAHRAKHLMSTPKLPAFLQASNQPNSLVKLLGKTSKSASNTIQLQSQSDSSDLEVNEETVSWSSTDSNDNDESRRRRRRRRRVHQQRVKLLLQATAAQLVPRPVFQHASQATVSAPGPLPWLPSGYPQVEVVGSVDPANLTSKLEERKAKRMVAEVERSERRALAAEAARLARAEKKAVQPDNGNLNSSVVEKIKSDAPLSPKKLRIRVKGDYTSDGSSSDDDFQLLLQAAKKSAHSPKRAAASGPVSPRNKFGKDAQKEAIKVIDQSAEFKELELKLKTLQSELARAKEEVEKYRIENANLTKELEAATLALTNVKMVVAAPELSESNAVKSPSVTAQAVTATVPSLKAMRRQSSIGITPVSAAEPQSEVKSPKSDTKDDKPALVETSATEKPAAVTFDEKPAVQLERQLSSSSTSAATNPAPTRAPLMRRQASRASAPKQHPGLARSRTKNVVDAELDAEKSAETGNKVRPPRGSRQSTDMSQNAQVAALGTQANTVAQPVAAAVTTETKALDHGYYGSDNHICAATLELESVKSELVLLRDRCSDLESQRVADVDRRAYETAELDEARNQVDALTNALNAKRSECRRYQSAADDAVFLSERLENIQRAHEQIDADAQRKIQYLEETVRAHKAFEESHAKTATESTNRMREYRRRLLIRSFWFQAQLAKLDRLAESCMQFDQFIRPEFTCSSCLAFIMQPTLVTKCGHTFCRQCIDAFRARYRSTDMSCEVCVKKHGGSQKKQPDAVVRNLIMENICSRYEFWRMNLLELRKTIETHLYTYQTKPGGGVSM